jgi:hypothetical protein
MNKLMLAGLAAAAIIAATPADAQVRVHEGRHGVSVHFGDRHHWRHHRRWHAYGRDCRTKVTRIHRHGRTIVRRVRSCH